MPKKQLEILKKIFLALILIFLWGMAGLWAQQLTEVRDSSKTSVQVKKTRERSPENNTEAFFDTILFKSSKNRWVKELHNIVIQPPQSKITDTLATIRADLEFLEYEGLVIRKISFVKLDVFGTSINDTIPTGNNWLENSANSIHVKTADRILRRHLIISEGEPIDPRVLADNLRLFRDLSYIEDAKIIVEPVESMDGYADITIILKDQWSMAFFVEMNAINAGKLELWDKNIFGTGNEFQNNIYWDPDKSKTWGYEAIYDNRNILGSFIDSRFQYTNVFDMEGYGLQFNRKFFTPNTKYAGGASAYHLSSLKNVWSPDSGYFKSTVSSNKSDLWIGRSIQINKYAGRGKNRMNLILASRIYKENYFDRPPIKPDLYYNFQDKFVWLNTIGLSSQSFYQSNLIYSYGRTEDIPIGSLANLTFGPEFGEFENRLYASVSYARGNYLNNLGYLYIKAEEGGYIARSGNFEQAMFQLKIKYFSNLFIYSQFKFRQFINFNFTKGVKRYGDDRININDLRGLRGFNEPNVSGQQRFVMNWESVAFTPWYVYGFRFTFFTYIDFAMLGPESANLIYEDVYTGLGLGARIKNERLVFPTISIRFGFYPNLNEVPLRDRFDFSGEPRFQPENFYLTNPSVLDFQ